MQCPNCDGKGYTYVRTITNPITGYGYKRVCDYCHGTGEIKQTNEEWLRQASTEELAEVLNKIFMTRTFCHICPEGGVCDIGYKCKYHGGTVEDFVEWLKQPHATRSDGNG